MTNPFEIELSKLQPSQLYISKKKLAAILKKFKPNDKSTLGIIPIKKLGDDIIYTDGHTRAYVAYKAKLTKILVEWENEDLDWEMYEICVNWCKSENIFTIANLDDRVISHRQYEQLWYKRCEDLHNKMEKERQIKENSR